MADNATAFEGGSFTVNEWCARRKVSRATLYNLIAAGEGPRIHKVGSRTLISAEADRAWVIEREAATTAVSRT